MESVFLKEIIDRWKVDFADINTQIKILTEVNKRAQADLIDITDRIAYREQQVAKLKQEIVEKKLEAELYDIAHIITDRWLGDTEYDRHSKAKSQLYNLTKDMEGSQG